jgi:replicative DNA helicase
VAALSAADFFDPVNRTIFAAMLRLDQAGAPPNVTLLIGNLRDHGELGADHTGVTHSDIAYLFHWRPLAWYLPDYVKRVADVSRRRHAYCRGIKLVQAARRGDPRLGIAPPPFRRAMDQAIERRAKRKGAG